MYIGFFDYLIFYCGIKRVNLFFMKIDYVMILDYLIKYFGKKFSFKFLFNFFFYEF